MDLTIWEEKANVFSPQIRLITERVKYISTTVAAGQHEETGMRERGGTDERRRAGVRGREMKRERARKIYRETEKGRENERPLGCTCRTMHTYGNSSSTHPMSLQSDVVF